MIRTIRSFAHDNEWPIKFDGGGAIRIDVQLGASKIDNISHSEGPILEC